MNFYRLRTDERRNTVVESNARADEENPARREKRPEEALVPVSVTEIDVWLVARILKVVLLDVYPKLFNDLRPGHRPRADHGGQFRADRHRLHKRRISCCHVFL